MTVIGKSLKGALVMLILFSTVRADDHGILVVGGGGIASCSEMLNAPEESIYEYQVKSWIVGFISGRNKERKALKGYQISEDTIFFAVKQYCRENPIDSVFQGANWLYENHLPDR